jgi:hypothetical protein
MEQEVIEQAERAQAEAEAEESAKCSKTSNNDGRGEEVSQAKG